MSAQEDEEVVARINASGADFVWVGLGAPKQENWMADHQGRVNGFMVGVGAGFDYFAGNIERAPEWMRRAIWNGCIDCSRIRNACLKDT